MADDRNDEKFVQLNRTFHELVSPEKDSDEGEMAARLFSRGSLNWNTLLADYRVVVLSEAGSGKTREIRQVAKDLKAEGKPAFFVRLEHVPNDFEDAFEEGTFAEFEEWLASTNEGWLLLDSVDEARLRSPSDFERAIKKVGNRIRSALQRTHIIITGRTTAWRPKTDRAICLNHLSYSAPRLAPDEIQEGKGGATKAVVVKQDAHKDEPALRIVALDDLRSPQIKIFAEAKGVEDTQALLDAIERADAYSFTSRPQDLADVIAFWNDHKRIGSRLELMRNSIERRLIERDQNRAEARPMTAAQARLGARLVAGATTVAQQQTIRVPDGAENLEGLPIASVLPSWDEKDCATLLGRPIFDEAIYGTVRFHHRSAREYLAAEWLMDLLGRETSRRSIEELFFREQYGLEVVVPSARPLLPWMMLLDQRIRDRALRLAPELVFEGGDPSQLPLEVRRQLLADICARIATERTYRTSVDYAAVQLFASADLANDIIQLLSKYAAKPDVTWLLLRMVWRGQIEAALPAAKAFALDPKAAKYTRNAAFEAVAALGTTADLTDIRTAFLKERRSLNREWLAELISITPPSSEATAWLIQAIGKTQPRPEFQTDGLAPAVQAYVEQAGREDLIALVDGFQALLKRPPIVERRFCEVSQRYRWLAKLAALAVQRLAETKDAAALGRSALDILRRTSMADDHDDYELRSVELRLPQLVQGWPELNDALFWYEVGIARKALSRKKGERLDDWWGVTWGPPMWAWEVGEIDRLLAFIKDRPLLDDRLIALSLAFRVYRTNGRPGELRRAMWKAVKGNATLEARLRKYMRPPPQSAQERGWKRNEIKWKRRREQREQKQAKYHEGWRTYLLENVEKLRDPGLKKPDHISNAQYYLHHELERENVPSRWRGGDWKSLIPKFGTDVAEAFRDGCVAYWRRNKPKLRSEGAAPNTTLFSTIFGLSGIGIEADETAEWPSGLTEADAELATRYATYELNGFPDWLPRLYAKFSDAVTRVLLGEVRWELARAIPESESLYVLYDVSWYGDWMWEKWAPILRDQLSNAEPVNLRSLEQMLKVIQGSSLPDEQVRDLARAKCGTVTDLERLPMWFAAWVGVDPDNAIPALSKRLDKIRDMKERLTFAMQFVTHLLGGRRGNATAARPAFRSVQHLKALYLLMHKHIRQRDDIERAGKGVYSPGLRDNAQDARNHLFNLLNEMQGKEAYVALMEISRAHPEHDSRPWFAYHAKQKAERDVETGPWSIAQFVDFNESLERTPSNNSELLALAWMRLLDLKADLEHGDSSIASILRTVTLETEIRKYIGNWLRDQAKGRYVVPQEEEFADATRPDIRFHGVGFDAPIPMELKLADNWTGPHLFERMENQLSGDYLRDRRSNSGIFALVYRGDKREWELPNSKGRVYFAGLVQALETHWRSISERYPNVIDLRVIGIDLTMRASKAKAA